MHRFDTPQGLGYPGFAMDYEAAVSWLLGLTNHETTRTDRPEGSSRTSDEVWDLSGVRLLLSALGDPHLGRPTIHIAGTKGKGSTAALTASALTASGVSAGLFTSPHLHTIRERLRVDGEVATPDAFAEAADNVHQAIEAIGAKGEGAGITTFEAMTAMAFAHFAVCEVAVQVIEVGLGGRLDATNLVIPTVSVITSLSMDHEAYLGDTIEAIASEKAGIVKPSVPVVSAPQEPAALAVIEARCRDLEAPLTVLGRDVMFRRESSDETGQVVRAWGTVQGQEIEETLRLGLATRHQLENAALAATALHITRQAGVPVSHDGMDRGFSTVDWPGRFEVVSQDPVVVVDGAHNPYSAMRLMAAVEEEYPRRAVHLVFGTSVDKDAEAIISELAPSAASMFTTASRHPRAADANTLSDAAWASGIPVRPTVSLAEALDRARNEARQDGGIVLVTGSLFVVAEAREAILGIAPELIPPPGDWSGVTTSSN